MSDKVRCIHRHSIDEHPACFYEGTVLDKRVDQSKAWWTQPGMKIGYLDIESDGLKADFATMLSWCIKEKDGKVTGEMITKNELFNSESPDKRLIDHLIAEMRKYTILVTYYGTNFDLPFIRTKSIRYGLDFPHYIFNDKDKLVPEISHFDIFYTVKSKLLLSRSSLDNACDYFGIKGKTPIDKDVWRKAKYGDRNALLTVLDHNRGDVVILEELHNRLTEFGKWTKRGV